MEIITKLPGAIEVEIPHYMLLITGCLLCSYIAISFGELTIHKNLMHGKGLPKFIYRIWPYIVGIFKSHTIGHHGHWYREFDFEPDPLGRNENILIRPKGTLLALILFSPVVVLFFLVSPVLALTFIIMTFVHTKLWNVLHSQMHKPKLVFFAKWEVFRWLARYHYMHHQLSNKNYNIVFPLADYFLGTNVKPRIGDLRQMLYLGYLTPRSPRVKARVEVRRAAVEKERAALLRQTG